ncbi:DUF11 domain-containing protein [Spirosoma sp. BT702]|uniref:DUF11 domain-containing protein n=1 Tax=Spirosoma profusum TaxID=2771354 RepID=A0A926XSM5_9BACT|nr:SdrD B-like domain-containing protein [Spirosoma profusum]MBD2699199.1 DUF11 domain-containing protein [Spirosoma profusum]
MVTLFCTKSKDSVYKFALPTQLVCVKTFYSGTAHHEKYALLVKLFITLVVFIFPIDSTKAQCSLTISRVTTSGCYSLSGVSKATVSVEVAWQNAPTNRHIVITTGAQSRTITPGAITVKYGNGGTSTPTGSQTIVSPQVIAFEVNATGATGTVTAQFSNSAICSATRSYTTPASCLATVCSSGSLGGQVYNDYNANGIKDAGETNGVAGITITIYPCIGNPVSATTDMYGVWTTSASLTYPVRVEFSTIPEMYAGSSTRQGIDSRTTVQFITQSSCNVNLGVSDPTDYCQDNPLLVLPLYTSGNPLVAGTAGTSQGLIGIPYNSAGNGTSTARSFSMATSQTGTLWAQAYNKITKRLFSAATLKRHAGLGPGGLDAIYITNLTNQNSPSIPTYINLSSFGIDVGASSVPSNTARGLVGDKAQPSADPQSFSLIGTVGIGGMSMSSDGNTLYLMNIKNNSLYALDLSVYNITLNTSDISLKSGPHAIPGLGCVGGTQRSWAVKFSKGKVYVGSVCDALSGTKSNLRAGVFSFDPTTNTFNTQPIFDFPLTYPKGYADWADANITGWFPWTNSFASQITSITFSSGSNASITLIHPQPILTDIEFDTDGSMILALSDRAGLQQGHRNYSPSGSGDYSGRVAGDILRAFSRQGVFVLENAAKAGPSVGSRPSNNQGPGFGEFYVDDSGAGAGSDGLYHAEIGLGTLALRPGSGEVVAGVMDPTGINTPYNFIPFSGGIRHMNNTNGSVNNAFALYSSPTSGTRDGTFGKAAGLGDLELLCDQQQLLEIGNRVWLDENKDGVQEACESVLPGVHVSLYRSGTLVTATVTNTNGEYYFNNVPTSSTVTGTVSTTGLLPNTPYQLVFGTGSQFADGVLTLNNGKYLLTTSNSASATANDRNDSDAQVDNVAGITAPVISLTTGAYGRIDHTLDVGFTCSPTTIGVISTTLATCDAGTAQSNASITIGTIQNADKVFLVTSGIPSYTAAGSQPVSTSYVSFTGLSNPTSSIGTAYNVVLYNGPSCYTVVSTTLAQASCNVATPCNLSASVTAGLCASATNTYSATAVVTVENPTTGILTVTHGSESLTFATSAVNSATYTAHFNGLSSDGASHTVTATLASCSTSSTTYTAPMSCTTASLELHKMVDKSKARLGEIISYTVVLTNTGTTSANNVVVKDSMSVGLTYVANSATSPIGTTFTKGNPVSTWTISSIGAGQSLSLTLQGVADSTGIVHNAAFIPGDTVSVCTSIPARICADEVFEFKLTAPTGRSHYQWFKDGQPIPGATSNIVNVTAVGAYSLVVDNQNGQCSDFSCCPFIIEEDSIPHYQAQAIPATCVGNTAQSNGQIVLAGFQSNYTYQYSQGSSFTGSLSGVPQAIPANGIIVSTLASVTLAQAYTVRVYNQAGCYTDVTVLFTPTACGCPAEICVPFVLIQTKRSKRIGDPVR